LQQIEQTLQTPGQRGVLFEQAIDQRGVPRRMQRFVEADPVRPVALALIVPLGVVARRQAIDFGRAGRWSLLVEHFLVVAEFVEAPEVAVVVAVADLVSAKWTFASWSLCRRVRAT
jgi:hypothetical protein